MPVQKRLLSFFLCLSLSLLIMLTISCKSQPAAGSHQVISLNSGWEFHQKADGQEAKPELAAWRPAEVPGVVPTDLLRHKLIPDPYYRDNESKLQWIEKAEWEYRTAIQASPELLKHAHVELVFEGLDGFADVYVNDSPVLKSDNSFREWRADIKPQLKPGANALRVVFRAESPEAKKLRAADRFNALTHNEDKAYVRKAAYQYGWDWGPRYVTSGMWRPVSLDCWDDARISDFEIRQNVVSKDEAYLTAEVQIASAIAGLATVKVDYSDAGKRTEVARDAPLHAGLNTVQVPIRIAKPALWYPAGYGAQNFYQFHAHVSVENRAAGEAALRTGLRSVVLRRDFDQWGRSFEFVVNGIPIFAKGADVIPFDSFPSRVTEQQYRQVLQAARDANMNMIRHWGGGIYESQQFYDMCDELGLMVWEEFMFATPIPWSIHDNNEKEAEYQVRRLRNHPSIVIWCGNNELEWIWSQFGDSPLKGLTPEGRDRMWQEYMAIFSGFLPRIVAELTPETAYWPCSPSANYEWVANSAESGDVHNWDVWHGISGVAGAAGDTAGGPPEAYERSVPRFMTEYGFQAYPDMRTIESFTVPEDRRWDSPIMNAHQKNNRVNGNQKIRDYMRHDYPDPRDFASFVYLSQVMQARAVKVGAEHLRRNRPRTMGSIFWQLNDCWPVVSWASLDYNGRWKALQYYAKRFYNDLLVSPHEENGGVAVYVVSDRTTPTTANLRVRLLTFDGTALSEKSQSIEIPAFSSKIYLNLPKSEFSILKGYDPKKVFVAAELIVANQPVSSNTLFFGQPKDLQLPSAQVTSELTKSGDSYRLRLSSKVLARAVYASAANLDATYSDNYLDLLPGQPVEIEVRSLATLEQLRSALKVVSLTDAFAGGPGR